MNLAYAFFNTNNRLRSGWRFLVFLAFLIISGSILGFTGMALFDLLGIDVQRGSATSILLNGVLSLIPAILIGWLCGRFLENLPFRALGMSFTPRWLEHLIYGLIIGGVTIGFAAALAMIFGGIGFKLNLKDGLPAILNTLWISFIVFAVAAAFEEAVFRGYILQTFTRAGLAPLAIGLTAVLFGLVHFANPSFGWISSINTAIAGVWFGISYLKTRDLWFVFGLHFMWNWVQGAVMGIEVSGLTDITRSPVFLEIDSGPHWLTGGEYGIEGGLACTAALLVSTVLIFWLPILNAERELLAMTNSESGDELV
ncbi:MAG: type II CAAX endopeptidase family protein [Pyrinomonadaceae bacterium]